MRLTPRAGRILVDIPKLENFAVGDIKKPRALYAYLKKNRPSVLNDTEENY